MCPEFTVLGITVESYSLMYLAGAAAAMAVALRLARLYNLSFVNILLLYTAALCSGFTGASLSYMCVTYTPGEIAEQLSSGKLNTGLVFYGGLISGGAFTYLIMCLLKLDVHAYIRALLPGVPLAHALGRVGCFLSGCCYGKYLTGLGFRVPVQLIESLGLIIIFVLLLEMSLADKSCMVSRYLFMYAPLRFLLEFLRGDEIRGFFLCFSTSQWISLILILICAIWRGTHRQTHL